MASGGVWALTAIPEADLPLRNKLNSELPLVEGPPSARRVRADEPTDVVGPNNSSDVEGTVVSSHIRRSTGLGEWQMMLLEWNP